MSRRFLKVLFTYLATLVALQLMGILYLLREPDIYRIIFLAIFLGTILPLILAIIFLKVLKLS